MDRTKTIVHEFEFDEPVEEVWEILSDTERLNLVSGSGFTPYIAEDLVQPDGSVVRYARKQIGPFTWRWREGLGEWVEGRFMNHVRVFENGPFKELNLLASFAPTKSGTRVSLEFFARWSSMTGDVLNRIGFLHTITHQVKRGASKMMTDHRALKSTGVASPANSTNRRSLKRDAREQVAAAIVELQAGPYAHDLADKLSAYLSNADDLALVALRPLELADSWHAPPEQVIELFVAAHKSGLLAMRWEIMCPRCRGGKSQSLLLSDLPREVHCDSCNIDYERDFSKNVELLFSPSQRLRDLPIGTFCLMSPATTRHVKVQCDLQPAQIRTEQSSLPDGRYRIRTLDPGGEREVELFGGAIPEVRVSQDDIEIGNPGKSGEIRMINLDSRPRSIVIENTAWSEHCLTGPRVIGSPAFRSLCPEQLLRPGDNVEVDDVTILFSDLSGSTALYESIGDSRAFSLVRDHFEFLSKHIERNHGVIVKTIGDAVMAAFADPKAALVAAIAIQDDVGTFNSRVEQAAIELKIGLHRGQCIAVTTNGFLDYFGTTVNMAARLQSQAGGGEIVVSKDIASRSFTDSLVQGRKRQWRHAKLSGFDEPVRFLSVSSG
jgi:class 3 adenylate cyclase